MLSPCSTAGTCCCRACRIAKTLLVATLSKAVDLSFARIHSRSTLLPSTSSSRRILDHAPRTFRTNSGSVFTTLAADRRINRAAPAGAYALLEAMQERKVTIARWTHKLPAPFLVIATQNPVERAARFGCPRRRF